MYRRAKAAATTAVLSLAALAPLRSLHAQETPQDVQIQTIDLGHGVYMLMGQGGNLGLSVGADGAFLIDDQFAPLTDKILAAVRELSDAPVRFVINTHWHGDHTGGNENMGEAGALVVAHDNVRKRMSVEQFHAIWDRRYPPAPQGALPVVTFSEEVTFHLNGLEIEAFHVENAHTDGDAIIYFKGADVVHMGDTYFAGMYPFIDVETGGSISGVIAAVEAVLEMIGDETVVIPGHGAISNKAELQDYVAMLIAVRAAVLEEIGKRKDADQVVAAKPTDRFDEKWGGGFIQPDVFTRMVYADLSGDD